MKEKVTELVEDMAVVDNLYMDGIVSVEDAKAAMDLPDDASVDIEELAELVHKAYCKEYERQKGAPYWTHGDYTKLDENIKEYDRVTVRAILSRIFSA